MILAVGCNSGASSATSSSSSDTNAPVSALVCSSRDKRLGTLRFPQGGAPTLTLEAQGPDADALKAAWEKLLARGEIKVKFHEDRDDERRLVGIQASPGQPAYGRAVQLKMAEEYSYDCEAEPTSPARR